MSAIPSEIEALYKDWLAICAKGDDVVDDEDAHYERYRALQDRIISIEPVTARDLAIQHYVDTDNGGSGHSDDFEEKIEKMIAGGAHG